MVWCLQPSASSGILTLWTTPLEARQEALQQRWLLIWGFCALDQTLAAPFARLLQSLVGIRATTGLISRCLHPAAALSHVYLAVILLGTCPRY